MDAFCLEGAQPHIRLAELAALARKAADAAFRAGQKALYEAVLRPEGFLHWKGAAFVRRGPEDWLEVIERRKERYGTQTFTVNCMAAPLFLPGAEPDMTFGERLGILAVGRDVWWDFAPGAAEGSFRNVGEALRRFGLLWFESRRGDGARKPFCGRRTGLGPKRGWRIWVPGGQISRRSGKPSGRTAKGSGCRRAS